MTSFPRRTRAAASVDVVALELESCGPQASPPARVEGPVVKMSEFDVEEMSCRYCECAIQTNVRNLDGAETMQASHIGKMAIARYGAAKVKPEAIMTAIEKLGYTAKFRAGP